MKEIKKVGFGIGGKNYSVLWGLLEFQVVVVYIVKDGDIIFWIGDVILICDVGGGIIDFVLFEQCGIVEIVEFRECVIVQGINIGLMNIDLVFVKMVYGWLVLVRVDINVGCFYFVFYRNVEDIMMYSEEFQIWKYEFGNFLEV